MAKRLPAKNAVDEMPHPKKAAFLEAYAQTGNISRAATLVGLDRRIHYQWMQNDPDYPGAFHHAGERAVDALVAEARRRALEGVEEPVGWYQGVAGGTVQRYSDTLLIFLLKGLRPEVFSERIQHSGPGGGPLTIEHLVAPRRLGDGDSS